MAKDLLKLPQFDESIRKAAQVLQAEGFDLYNVLKSEDESTFDNVLNSFVSITVMQVRYFTCIYLGTFFILSVLGSRYNAYIGIDTYSYATSACLLL